MSQAHNLRVEEKRRVLPRQARENGDSDGGSAFTPQSTGQISRNTGNKAAKRSLDKIVDRLFSRLENTELVPSSSRKESSGPQDLIPEDQDIGAGISAETAAVPDVTHMSSDQESSEEEEEEGYSPLKTPRLPEKPRTPNTVLSKVAGRQQRAEDSRAGTAPKRKVAATSGRRKKPGPGLPTSVVKATFNHFCQLRVSKDAIEEVEKLSELYWKNMAEDLEAYATHANRKTITEADVELLMKRQRFITEKCPREVLIAKYLPLELRQALIPIARSGNRLELKPF